MLSVPESSGAAPSVSDPVPVLTRRKKPTVPFYYPDWLILREMALQIRRWLSWVGTGKLLDIGCGEKPYETYKPKSVTEWVGFDVPSNPTADVHGYAGLLPFPNASFETLICTEVLEHLPEPAAALAEMARVLKSEGHLILTCPLYFPLHEEPYDFFRYTPYGLRHLFEAAGLEIIDIRPLATGLRLVGTAINTCLNDFGKGLPGGQTWLGRAAFAPAYAIVNSLTFAASGLLPDRKNAVGHAVLAQKP